MTVGGRIYLKKDNSGLELVKAFAKIPTANIADTMGRSCAMHPRIKLFSSPHGTVWSGIALTVKSRGGDNLLIHAALDMAREGDVIVVSNEGGVDNRSLMGEIMFTYAAYKKLNGLVLDGPIRDVKSAKEIPLPIYATGSTPGGPYKEGPGEINVPISCGGISVNPGDIVVMDDDGVIIIPLKDASAVLAAAQKLQETDEAKVVAAGNGTAKREWVAKAIETKKIEIIDDYY